MNEQNNLLLKRPVSRPNVAAEWGHEPRLVVHHTHWISRLCARFFKTPSKTYLSLDVHSAFVWSHCDGTHTVGEIAQRFAEKFGPEAEPVMERLVVFLRILLGKKLIDLRD